MSYRLLIFPHPLDAHCELQHDAGLLVVGVPATHPTGRPGQAFELPAGTPNGNGATLTITAPKKVTLVQRGIVYLNDGLPYPWQDGQTAAFAADDFLLTDASSGSAITRRGIVRFDGHACVDDDGEFNPLTTTLLWALGRWHKGEQARAKQNFQWAKAKGCDAVRVLGQVGPNGRWKDIPIDPAWPTYEAELGAVIDCAYDECGLRVKVTLIGGGDPDPVGSARKVAAVVLAGRQHKILLLEAVNEGNDSVEHADAIARVFATTGVPFAVGLGDQGIDTIEAASTAAQAPVACYHTSRVDGDNGARQVRQCWDFKEFKRASDDGEGPGPGSSVADFPEPFKNAAKRAGNIICGAALTCIHTGSGVYGDTYQAPTGMRYANLWEQPNADAVFDAVRHADDHLPKGIANWRKFNTNHPVEIASGSVNKLYGAERDGRFAEIAIGCESPIVCRATRAVHVTFWNPATGESCGEFTLTAGQTCQPSGALWAYVITGEPA